MEPFFIGAAVVVFAIIAAIIAVAAWSGEVVGSMRCAGYGPIRLTVRRKVRTDSDFASVWINARVGWSIEIIGLRGAEPARLADALESAASKGAS